jgi:hypothetical protein
VVAPIYEKVAQDFLNDKEVSVGWHIVVPLGSATDIADQHGNEQVGYGI